MKQPIPKFNVGDVVTNGPYGLGIVREIRPAFRGEHHYIVEALDRREIGPMDPPQLPGDRGSVPESMLEKSG